MPNFIMRNIAILIFLMMVSCGGSGGNSKLVEHLGLYRGTPIYSIDGETQGGCLDFIKQCFSSIAYELQISEKYFPDGTSVLILERPFGAKLAEAPPLSSSVEFSEVLSSQGPCGFVGSDVICSGVRNSVVKSESSADRVINVDGTITATCSSEAGVFECLVDEEVKMQG